MNDKGYPKYQFSVFGKSGEQYVVRAETIEELTTAIDFVKRQIAPVVDLDAPVKPVATQTPIVATGLLRDYCKIHQTSMKQRVGKDEKVFYSHAKLVDGTWEYCNGVSGFAFEKREEIDAHSL